MKIGYVRVSTEEQNEARQFEALEKYGIEQWYTEKVSGKNMERPQLQEMLRFARRGDTVYIKDFSRVSRNLSDLLELVEDLKKKEVQLVSDYEKIDTSSPAGTLMLALIGAINEFERTNMLERQREGIEIAKRRGKYKGRARVHVADMAGVYDKYVRRESTKGELARSLGISRPTLNRLILEWEKKE